VTHYTCKSHSAEIIEKNRVLPESSAELVVVHIGLGLSLAPSAGHLVGVGEFELAVGAFPSDAGRVGRVGQQLEQELPQLNLPGACMAITNCHKTL
jgi:hypothetical protein